MHRSLLLTCALAIAGCAEAVNTPTSVATQTLHPRQEPTATATVEPQIDPVETVGPSPTPLTHLIIEGDTLLSIAIRYGVELPDLLVVNPGVNPRLLVIGESISIPRSGAQGPVPTATPVPIELSEVTCYELKPAGLTCMLTASALGDTAVEGVVALVTIADSEGIALQTEPAYSPTNLVLPNRRIPLIATFAQSDPRFSFASAAAIGSLNASEVDSRYAELDLAVESTEIALDGLSARVVGTVELLGDATDRSVTLRLVALAIGEGQVPVGFRTWERPDNGSRHDFDITVYSLGPTIEKLEIISEAPFLP